MVLSCFPRLLADVTPHAPDQYDFRVLLFPVDFAFVAVIVLAVFRRRLGRLPAMAAVVLATLALAWCFHPSLRGGQTLFRWAAVVAIVALVNRRSIPFLAGGWAVFESLLAIAQHLHGGPVGLAAVGESALSFLRFGHALAPPGTLVHPYLLAGLGLLGGAVLANEARERRWLLVPAAVAVAPVGFTYSRTALLAVGLLLVCCAIARFPAAVLALAVGAGVPALVWHDGWVIRAQMSSSATSPDQFDSARGAMVGQSVDFIKANPLTGVGPGRYVISLKDKHVSIAATFGPKPVHNLPLLAAAEGGVAAGLAMTALLLMAGYLAVRAGAMATGIYVAFLPFCLLDHFAYTFPQGMVMLGLWLGAIATAGRRPRAVPVGSEA
ncbi:MAG: O-antigen ligase family protein [Actinobacteria bacterium]|nr:O-antigen ligase family protein [Actinomycetota bacterium]